MTGLAAALLGASLLVLVARPRTRWLLPGVGPILAGAAISLATGGSHGVLAVWVGVALCWAMAIGIDVVPWVDATVGLLAKVVRAVTGAGLVAVVLLPGWAWTRLRRHDALGRTTGASTWVVRSAQEAEPRSMSSEVPSTGGSLSLVGRLAWAVGAIVLLLGANYGIGWAWDSATGSEGADSISAVVDPVSGGDIVRDPRVDAPGMAAYPWRERYFADLQRGTGGYWPFTEFRPNDFASPYINIEGWTRATYEPAGDAAEQPVAWMFGGSTTWGEGQRDEYTIASWIARLSEQAGTPLRVVNFGQRGWTHFQEMVLFEQRVAIDDPPDLAVFYDGVNEINTQSLVSEPVPSHCQVPAYAEKLTGTRIVTQLGEPADDAAVLSDLYWAYTKHSAVHKVLDLLRSTPADAAPALPRQEDPPTPGVETTTSGRGDDGQATFTQTRQDGIDAGQVYERGKQLTLTIARQHDVEPFLFWQPEAAVGEPQRLAKEQLTPPTIDISDALEDAPEVFIDGGHTNEEGARIVAERIWQELEPSVRAWYRERS